uniref:RBR-type E3 ubiquitin transferase n=1 Tax=Athene cunicularia TaxID=194338 RepID=A0A663LZZ2_ATHCN
MQVQLGQADIKCPITECNEHLDETTVLYNLPHDDIIKYKYFLELSRIDSSTKPCPQCKHFTTFRRRGHIPTPAKLENKYKIQCPSCQFVWCFKCHSPWHEGVNCKEYKKGDKLLRHWANEIEHGQRNAQKCPKCKIHIQRTEGCDHMTCSQCNTNFCYRCGERYRQLRFFGDHTSNLSIFGCKYRYLPERPHLRRLVRGSVCGIPFTYTDIPSPCYQQTEKVLPHDEMEECKAAFECTPPVLESIFRNGGVDLMNCGKTYIVEFVHLHTRGFTMSSSNIYL